MGAAGVRWSHAGLVTYILSHWMTKACEKSSDGQ
ncbi:hypothetical protein CBM2598_U10287 [Cupriavidus taiwanensis]|uniref:Uncharacterized protein n=1 Tax=Cupriavidus taiwanensis TaxID=164546 RepID=A0A7Z7JFD9_9BURK|nr:hypothetical protein CBM2597_U10064 [Cupriavidus taiwanensis]SOZ96498.1 hypothetical protein CBM2598_U10287 [Cupriavidus taiwanensis]SPC25570.1 hypothetical protein CBM2594_U10071 [Cupriavidus taiwanensis]